jgi:outer membrane receptor for ferrienterochelin and colicins
MSAPCWSWPALFALALALGFRAARASAQQAAQAGAATAQPAEPIDVVVTGSRLPQLSSDSTVAVEVIRRSEIERSGARDAAELLEERAGLQLSRSFRGSELWLRGLDPEYTLVLLDGERVPGRVDGAIDLSRFGVEGIERIEIVRGPSSALYGADAIGGVVNIIPRASQRELEADAMVSAGTRGVYDATALIAGRPSEALQLQANGGLHQADAFARDGGPATAGSARSQWSGGGRAALRLDADQRLVMRAQYRRGTLQGVDEGAASALFDRTQQQEQLDTGVRHDLDTASGVELSSRIAYSQFREQYLSDQRNGDQLDRYEDNREHSGQLGSVLRVPLAPEHVTTVGAEQLLQRLDSERLSRLGQRYGLALFAQHQWTLFERDEQLLELVPGARFDLDSQFGNALSPKLAVRFQASKRLVLRASYGRGFRAPSFQELLLRFENPSVGYLVAGNPELGVETSHGADVGVQWLPSESFAASLGLFRNDLSDMIAIVSSSAESSAAGTLFSYDNLQSAWTMGLESFAQVRVDEVFTSTFGYGLTETWDGENERRLEGRARHRFTARARVEHPGWELELTARASLMLGRTFYPAGEDGDESELVAPALAQLDLRVAKHFTRHFELFAGADNLLDAGDRYSVLRPATFYGGARGRY